VQHHGCQVLRLYKLLGGLVRKQHLLNHLQFNTSCMQPATIALDLNSIVQHEEHRASLLLQQQRSRTWSNVMPLMRAAPAAAAAAAGPT
jgi:predicted nucleotidyltransferase